MILLLNGASMSSMSWFYSRKASDGMGVRWGWGVGLPEKQEDGWGVSLHTQALPPLLPQCDLSYSHTAPTEWLPPEVIDNFPREQSPGH